jgi:hypothetical protein
VPEHQKTFLCTKTRTLSPSGGPGEALARAFVCGLLGLLLGLLALPALADGAGCMGGCAAKAPSFARAAASGEQTFPDVSEHDPSLLAPVATVIRLYESGLNIEDSNARVDSAQLRSDRVWFGGYAYLTGAESCTYEAARTVAIVNAIGGLNGPIIADAETRLPAGFVQCFLASVARDDPRYAKAEATYSSCSAWPGGKVPTPFWTAEYQVSAPCTPEGVPYVAWQYVSAEEGGHCGEAFPSDCSYDAGITNLRPGPTPTELKLEADIRERERQEQNSTANKARDEARVAQFSKELARAKEPRRRELLADIGKRQADERYLASVIATDQHLIGIWRAGLSSGD